MLGGMCMHFFKRNYPVNEKVYIVTATHME
jgi:hypothetical protein